jgi:hypothetical protein
MMNLTLAVASPTGPSSQHDPLIEEGDRLNVPTRSAASMLPRGL